MGDWHVGNALTQPQWQQLEETVRCYDLEKFYASSASRKTCNLIENGRLDLRIPSWLSGNILKRLDDRARRRWYSLFLDVSDTNLLLFHASVCLMREGNVVTPHTHNDPRSPKIIGTVAYQLNMNNEVVGGEFVGYENGLESLQLAAGVRKAVIFRPNLAHAVRRIESIEPPNTYRASIVLHYQSV